MVKASVRAATTRDSLGRVELAFLLCLEHVEHVGEREQTVAVARLPRDQRQRLVPRARSLHAGQAGLVELGAGQSTARVGDATTDKGARLDVHGQQGTQRGGQRRLEADPSAATRSLLP